ncbi:MAG TPA: hypothetical protein VGX76_13710, partial [Pirellulales bacterium]|nr:hypothetical protein [Pirellulales bacterium]
MNAFANLQSSWSEADVWPFLVDTSMKAAVLVVFAALACLAMRRSSAGARHRVWTIGLTGALVLPALSPWLPSLTVRLLPVRKAAEPVPAIGSESPAATASMASGEAALGHGMPNDIRPAETRVDVSSRLAVPGTAVVTQSRLTWRAALVLTWLMGLLGML